MAATHATDVEHQPQSFIRRYIFSQDHKVIGLQYLFTAAAVALVAGGLAMLIRMQLAWPNSTWPTLQKLFPAGMADGIMKPEFYLSLVTMHGTLMV
ncbi:MAG TPA: cytochrome c oxidase subunit I, partial [Terriglobia bacterium]|nr:cytochrome c oxidase subunit I [Terriglobia bacterium]